MAPALGASDAVAVVGLGFGDEGKGSVVDALARRLGARLIARFNGGPQAAHHVVTPDGRTHCFAQFGSGLLASPGINSVSGPRVLIEPLALLREADALAAHGVSAPLTRLRLHPRSVVVTPFHRLRNRAHEILRGGARHGSCGLGVGHAYMDSLDPSAPTVRLDELHDPARLQRKLNLMRLMALDWVDQQTGPDLSAVLSELRRDDIVGATLAGYAQLRAAGVIGDGEIPQGAGPLILEGAQGVLLDERHGFWPHVTPSTTTFAWADELRPGAYRLGVLRAFSTRHGAGPFVAGHEPSPEALLRGEHNGLNPWQGTFRAGWFDLLMARHALAVAGPIDGLALTCLDRLAGLPRVGLTRAYRYQGDADEVRDLFEIEHDTHGPIVTDLRAYPDPSRERQTRLARALERCSPVVEFVEGFPTTTSPALDRFVALIEGALGVPVVLRSLGPTAADKTLG